MKSLSVVILSTMLLLSGIAYAKDYEVSKKTGDYDVQVKIDKNPPVVGNNNIDIGVRDSSGKYITDAKVSIAYVMPAMPGMPAMKYNAEAEVKGNEYKAKMDLSMAGSWNITVKITRAGKTSSMKFTVDAH